MAAPHPRREPPSPPKRFDPQILSKENSIARMPRPSSLQNGELQRLPWSTQWCLAIAQEACPREPSLFRQYQGSPHLLASLGLLVLVESLTEFWNESLGSWNSLSPSPALHDDESTLPTPAALPVTGD